jgi:hypothetical protein
MNRFSMSFLSNGVVSAGAERLTLQQPDDRSEGPSERTMATDRLDGIA